MRCIVQHGIIQREPRFANVAQFTFAAGTPGTYYYWARTTEPLKIGSRTVLQPLRGTRN